jgi:hypothetical protein
MTEQQYAIEAGHPPQALLRLVNPILAYLLNTPLLGAMRKQFMVLSFTGRKSGRAFSIPLSAHIIDDDLYALSGAPWKQNFRDGARALVVYNKKTTEMRGELVSDRATVADLYKRCADSYGAERAQRMIGLKFRDEQLPTLEEFAEAVDRMHLGAVRLTPAKQRAQPIIRPARRRWPRASG